MNSSLVNYVFVSSLSLAFWKMGIVILTHNTTVRIENGDVKSWSGEWTPEPRAACPTVPGLVTVTVTATTAMSSEAEPQRLAHPHQAGHWAAVALSVGQGYCGEGLGNSKMVPCQKWKWCNQQEPHKGRCIRIADCYQEE